MKTVNMRKNFQETSKNSEVDPIFETSPRLCLVEIPNLAYPTNYVSPNYWKANIAQPMVLSHRYTNYWCKFRYAVSTYSSIIVNYRGGFAKGAPSRTIYKSHAWEDKIQFLDLKIGQTVPHSRPNVSTKFQPEKWFLLTLGVSLISNEHIQKLSIFSVKIGYIPIFQSRKPKYSHYFRPFQVTLCKVTIFWIKREKQEWRFSNSTKKAFELLIFSMKNTKKHLILTEKQPISGCFLFEIRLIPRGNKTISRTETWWERSVDREEQSDQFSGRETKFDLLKHMIYILLGRGGGTFSESPPV